MTSPDWIQAMIAGVVGVFSGIAVTYGMVKGKVDEAKESIGEFCDRITAVEKQGNKMFTKISVLESQLKDARAAIDKAEEDRHNHP
jgi:uncharacterized membrane protein (DUF106 family)